MPVERLVAGPRSLNAALLRADGFAELAGGGSARLVHGPLLGDVRPTSAKIWVRAGRECDIKAVIEGVAAAGEKVSAESDYTAVIQLNGLEPDTLYHYQIFQDEEPLTFSYETSFRTPPADGGERIKIAFGGGSGFTPKFEHMWDDHDFGTNDCHGGAAVDDPPWKPRVWTDFQLQWPNPEYGGAGEMPGCYFTHKFGDRVEFFFLDTRYYREPALPQMLGPEQLAWFKAKLKASTATFKVICSSVPMTPGVKPGSKDTWDGHKEEREGIFKFIADEKISGVFVIAADRHRSDAWKNERPDGAYPIYEFMSSRPTNTHTHKIIDGCLFGYNAKPSFGEVEFDFSKDDPTATYRAFSIDDEKVGEVVLRMGDLK